MGWCATHAAIRDITLPNWGAHLFYSGGQAYPFTLYSTSICLLLEGTLCVSANVSYERWRQA